MTKPFDPNYVYIACSFTDPNAATEPAPVEFHMIMLEIKQGVFEIMQRELAVRAMETHPGDGPSDEEARTFISGRELHENVQAMMRMALSQIAEHYKEAVMINMYFQNGPKAGQIFNARSDNWPDTDVLTKRIEELNPVISYRIEFEIKKPALIH